LAVTATYPTGAIRDALERAANDPELPASARQRELRTIRDELKHLAGYADSLLGNLSLAEQRDALDRDEEFRLAEDAAIREEMLRRGLATEDQLDELGLHASAEVAERRADGTLAESVSAADFLAYQHPRGRAGQFVDALRDPVPHAHPPAGLGGPGQEGLFLGGSLPESMPPPRPDDPLIALGVPPLVADGLRADEPQNVLNLPAPQRREAEEAVGRMLLDHPEDWPMYEDAARERWELWREAEGHDPASWTPPEGVTYSPEVQKIASPADAEAYLKGRGVDARLTPPDTEQGRHLASDTDWFRQIAQAVTDAQDRYPVLTSGAHPLGTVALWSDTNQWERSDVSVSTIQDAVWGVTGYEVADADRNPRMLPMTFGQDDLDGAYTAADSAGHKTDILISDVDQDFLQSRQPSEGVSDADITPYGRMTHELGHAVYSASGLQDEDLESSGDNAYVTLDGMVQGSFTPSLAMEVSPYAGAAMTEAWAEFFSTLNVPGAYESLAGRSPGAAVALQQLRERANQVGAERGVGRLL
jgi:hypothetical protein